MEAASATSTPSTMAERWDVRACANWANWANRKVSATAQPLLMILKRRLRSA